MLRVDRQHLHALAPRRGHHGFARHHEDLLRGHGDVLARLDRREGGFEAGDSDDGDENEVGLGQGREFDEARFAAVEGHLVREGRADAIQPGRVVEATLLNPELGHLCGEGVGAAVRGESDELHAPGQIAGDLEGTLADRSGRA